MNQETLTLAKNIAHKVWGHALLKPYEIQNRQEYNKSIPTDVPSNISLFYKQFTTARDKDFFLELAFKSGSKHSKKLIEWILNHQNQSSMF